MKRNMRKIWLCLTLTLVFGIVFSSISFSYQNGYLDINGNSKVYKNSWNIYIKNLDVIDNFNDSNKITINNKSTDIDLNLSFNDKSEYVTFAFDIVNDSLYDLSLANILLLDLDKEVASELTLSYTYQDGNKVNIKDKIKSGEIKRVKVLVKNNKMVDIYDLKFSIRFVYIQSD